MKPAILLTLLAFASCIMPTETSTSTAELGASWYDVRDECYRYCNVLDGMCASTSGPQWYTDCLALCVDIADEAYAADCLDTAEAWMRCEWADQPWQCNGPWAWASPDACAEERGAYEVCR